MFDKIYKDKNRFNDTDNNFNFKVMIFYNKYRQVKSPPNDYIYITSIMFFGQAQIYYYTNYRDIFTFDQFYTNIQLVLEGLE